MPKRISQSDKHQQRQGCTVHPRLYENEGKHTDACGDSGLRKTREEQLQFLADQAQKLNLGYE